MRTSDGAQQGPRTDKGRRSTRSARERTAGSHGNRPTEERRLEDVGPVRRVGTAESPPDERVTTLVRDGGRVLDRPSQGPTVEDGSGTIWFAGVAAGMTFIALLLIAVGGAWSAKTHLQAVADMAALAGADLSSVSVFEPVPDGTRACQQAAAVADANDVSLRECWTSEGDTFVIIQESVGIVGWRLEINARARAGPTTA